MAKANLSKSQPPVFCKFLIFSSYFAGGYRYMHVAKPGLNTPLSALMNQNDYVSQY